MNKPTKWYVRPFYAFMSLTLVAGLILVPTLVPVASPIVEANISGITVTVSNPTPNETSNYIINFTTTVSLTTNADDTITVQFPTGTTDNTTISGLTTSHVTVNTRAPSSVSTGAQRVSITPSATVNAGNVSVVFTGSKITNPVPEGNYTLKVYTSQEPTAVTSPSYIIDTIISACTVTPAPTNVTRTASYSLNATLVTALVADADTITITFPATTTVPTSIAAKSYVTINNTALDVPADYSASGQAVTLNTPAAFGAGTLLINFTTDVALKNPTVAKDWTLTIYTSKDRGVKTSSTYSITSFNQSAITHINWSSYDAYIPNNTASTAFKITTKDTYGNNATVDINITFVLGAGGAGSYFFSNTACTSPITTINITHGQNSSASFYFKSTSPGTKYVTAGEYNTSYGWTEANASIIANPMIEIWGGGAKAASYRTISAAANAALPYDTIKLYPSTYGDNATVSTCHVTIESTGGKANTVIIGMLTLNANAHHFTLGGASGKGLTLKAQHGQEEAIHSRHGVDNVTIFYNSFSTLNTRNASYAICLKDWDGGVPSSNTSTCWNITQNDFTIAASKYDNWDQAIRSMACNVSNWTITNNTFTGNGTTIDHCAMEFNRLDLRSRNNFTINGNTFTNIDRGIIVGQDSTGAGLVAGTGRLFITNNIFTTCSYGIHMKNAKNNQTCQNVTINTNNFTNCTYGLTLNKGRYLASTDYLQAENWTVRHNNFNGSTYGVYNNASRINFLTATLCWWGSSDGPGPVGPGSGAKVSTKITYSPWLNAAYPGGNTTAFSSITLQRDWNFISVPRKMENATFGYLLSGMNVSLSYGYDPSTGWMALNNSSAVEVLDGYWIAANAAGTINLTFVSTGQEVPASKNLTGKKWNAIGFSNTTAMPANATLKSVEGSWSTAMGWNATSQSYDTSIIYELNDATNMNPGRGYWLWMTANDTLAALSA